MVAHALDHEWVPRPHPRPALPILASRRCTSAARLGAAVESHALVHTRFRLDVARNCNVVCDEKLLARAFEPRGRLERPQVLLVLEGRARVEQDGVTWNVAPGHMLLSPARRGARVRQEGPRFLSVSIEWDPGTLGGAVRAGALVPLSAVDVARARAIVDAIAAAAPNPGEGCMRFAEMVAVLRESGAPLDVHRPSDFAEGVEPSIGALSRALDESLSDLRSRPMVIDLEQALGVSIRHLQRLVTAFHARYAFDARGWRDALNRRRLRVGAALMTAPGAGTEVVAAAVGYGSSAALCRAFADFDLPPPTAVPRILREPG